MSPTRAPAERNVSGNGTQDYLVSLRWSEEGSLEFAHSINISPLRGEEAEESCRNNKKFDLCLTENVKNFGN